MRTLGWSGKRGDPILHIVAPGCIINIHKGLTDSEGREVVRVDVLCDKYAGEPSVTLPDFDNATAIGIRIVREADNA
jgi:hypothetical protein